eukprot:5650932-Pyramimonas_sp.AAC.1
MGAGSWPWGRQNEPGWKAALGFGTHVTNNVRRRRGPWRDPHPNVLRLDAADASPMYGRCIGDAVRWPDSIPSRLEVSKIEEIAVFWCW